MVNLAAFAELGPKQARAFLADYLKQGDANVATLLDQATEKGAAADFTTASLPLVLGLVLPRVRLVRVAVPEDVPSWLRDDSDAFMEFDEPSRHMVLTTSHYLGETFVRSFVGRLSWNVGSPKTLLCSQPVIAGFLKAEELPVLMVTEALLERGLKGREMITEVQTAVDYWTARHRVPADSGLVCASVISLDSGGRSRSSGRRLRMVGASLRADPTERYVGGHGNVSPQPPPDRAGPPR